MVWARNTSGRTREVCPQKTSSCGYQHHEILKGYAAIVEGLALFDPSFVLLHKVCRKIRDYVKKRPDTMRTIITFITQEKPGDIHTNNSNRLTLMLDEEQLMDINDEYVIMNDDNLDNRWFDWKPDPRDADPKESVCTENQLMCSICIGIYGSKDLFVKESTTLSERLISNGWDKHLQSEFTYLETMKKRFTDGELNSCEVMLRDIKESGKLAKTAALASPFPISPRVVSSVYWPELSQDNQTTLSMNKTVKPAVAQYENASGPSSAADAILEKESWNMDEIKEMVVQQGFLVKSGLDEVTLEEIYTLSASSSAIERLAKENQTLTKKMF
uniref:Anaphase-promoting complex subunit 2 TPR repeats domain-containing protein n=1 Tax=Ditylenchus dipsaci TaxID=166011 RepID=A0A915D121_9BILA